MELWTTTQAAARLRCTPKVLSRYINEGRLTAVFWAPGDRGAAFFDPADVNALALELADEALQRAAELKKAAS